MATSCPWPWPRWRATTRSCAPRNTGCSSCGSRAIRASCSFFCPTPSAPRNSCATRREWVANWTGQRIDSKDAYVAGDEYIAWLERHGCDPRQKRLIASDALDVEQILGLHAYFAGTLRNGATPDDFRSASDFDDARPLGSRAPHPLQRRLGHAAHQRFPQLQSAGQRRLQSRRPGLQAD